ncbi:hypothetical protein ACS0TY_011541 [Phlomoides rotata]
MEGMESSISTDTGKKSDKGSSTRRVWAFQEEHALVNRLKELVARGYKVDNGFKAGYVGFLESWLMNAFPGTDLKGDLHINSKIHVWKKHFGSLSSMFLDSGIGLHNISYMIDAHKDKWVAVIKKDPLASSLKNKSFPFYNDWKEIFGKDRATGENSQTFADVVQKPMNKEGQCDPSIGVDQAPKSSHFKSGSQDDFQSDLRA